MAANEMACTFVGCQFFMRESTGLGVNSDAEASAVTTLWGGVAGKK